MNQLILSVLLCSGPFLMRAAAGSKEDVSDSARVKDSFAKILQAVEGSKDLLPLAFRPLTDEESKIGIAYVLFPREKFRGTIKVASVSPDGVWALCWASGTVQGNDAVEKVVVGVCMRKKGTDWRINNGKHGPFLFVALSEKPNSLTGRSVPPPSAPDLAWDRAIAEAFLQTRSLTNAESLVPDRFMYRWLGHGPVDAFVKDSKFAAYQVGQLTEEWQRIKSQALKQLHQEKEVELKAANTPKERQEVIDLYKEVEAETFKNLEARKKDFDMVRRASDGMVFPLLDGWAIKEQRRQGNQSIVQGEVAIRGYRTDGFGNEGAKPFRDFSLPAPALADFTLIVENTEKDFFVSRFELQRVRSQK